MITNEKRDKALKYLADTDEPCARAKALMIGLEKEEKTILGIELLAQKGKDGTVGEKEATARISEAYEHWRERYENAVADYEIMRNRRITAALIVEVWRSEFSARKQGMIV